MKAVCNKHEQAYEVSDGCPWCEKPQLEFSTTHPELKDCIKSISREEIRLDGDVVGYRWRPVLASKSLGQKLYDSYGFEKSWHDLSQCIRDQYEWMAQIPTVAASLK